MPLYNVKWTVTGNFPLPPGEKDAAMKSLQQEIQRSLTATPFQPAHPTQATLPHPAFAPHLQAQAPSLSTPTRPRRGLSFNKVRDDYILRGDMSPSTLSHFVSAAAEDGHRNVRDTDVISPNRVDLFNRFKDLNEARLDDSTKSQLKNHASLTYVKRALHKPPTVTTTWKGGAPPGESQGRKPPPGDPIPVQPMPPSPKNLENSPPVGVGQRRQHYNVWENVPVAFTSDNELLAKDFLERKGIGTSVRTQLKRAPLALDGTPIRPDDYHNEFKCIVGDKKNGVYPRGHCSARLIREKCSETPQFQVKIVRSETCACRNNEYGPSKAPSIVEYHMQKLSLSRESPSSLTKDIMKEMTANDYWGEKLRCTEFRAKLKCQIMNQVKYRKKILKKDPLHRTIQNNGDLTYIKQHYMFNLPPPGSPVHGNFPTEESVQKLGEELYRQDHLKPAQPDDLVGDVGKQAYRLQTILDGRQDEPESNLSAPEIRLYRRIKELMTNKKDPIPDAWEKMAVCTSLALLWNMKQVHDLDDDCTLSADGTDNMAKNNYRLLNWGCFAVNTTGKRSFRPFGVAFAPNETELYFSILLVTLLKYGRRLFGITEFNFKGLQVSDHSAAFVNTFCVAFPEAKPSQCYPHIVRKFEKGEGNGQYLSKYNRSFIGSVGVKDVKDLRMCLTKQMFETHWEMVSQAWDDLGETDFRKTFQKSYIRNPRYNTWYIGASGRAFIYPDNNPNEKWTGDIKGTTKRASPAKTGRELGTMLREELPRIIYHSSLNSVGVSSPGYLVDDESKVFTPSKRQEALFKFASNNEMEIDVYPPGNVETTDNAFFYVNTLDAEERCITEKRVQFYEDALKGTTHFLPADRHKFIQSTTSLCKVQRIVGDDGSHRFRGSCMDFLQSGYCVHSAYLCYGERLQREATRIETHRKRKLRTQMTNHQRSDKVNRQQLTKACHSIANSITTVLTEALALNLPLKLIELLRSLPNAIAWLDETQHNSIQKWKSEKIDKLVLPIQTQAQNVVDKLDVLNNNYGEAALDNLFRSVETLKDSMKVMEGRPTSARNRRKEKKECSGPSRRPVPPPVAAMVPQERPTDGLLQTCGAISECIASFKKSAPHIRENLARLDNVKAKLMETRLSAILDLPDPNAWYSERIEGHEINQSVMATHMENATAALRPAVDLQSSFQGFVLEDSAQSQKCTTAVDADIESLKLNLAMLTGGKPVTFEPEATSTQAWELPRTNVFTPTGTKHRNMGRRRRNKPTGKQQPVRRSQRKNKCLSQPRRSGRRTQLTEKMRAHLTTR